MRAGGVSDLPPGHTPPSGTVRVQHASLPLHVHADACVVSSVRFVFWLRWLAVFPLVELQARVLSVWRAWAVITVAECMRATLVVGVVRRGGADARRLAPLPLPDVPVRASLSPMVWAFFLPECRSWSLPP